MAGSAFLNLLKSLAMAPLIPFIWLWGVLKDWMAGRLPTWANLVLEFVVLLVFAGLLALLNWQLELERYLTGPLQLRKIWLGLVALLGYLTARMFVLMLRQLPRGTPEFSDITQAIQAGVDAAIEARVNLQDSPVFLVLGATPEVEDGLITSTFVENRIRVTDPELPAHWFGGPDAIWLTIPGISAISEQSKHVEAVGQAARKGGRPTGNIRLSNEAKERTFQRMKYLMKQLGRLRNPVVPINGVVCMVPYSWMTDPTLAQLADTVKIDMLVAQSDLGVKCMCLMLFHGIDTSAEFRAYAMRMPEMARQRRCGCTLLPFTEHVDQDSGALHTWLYRFFRQQIYGIYKANRSAANNGMLLRFLNAFYHAREGFCTVLANAFARDIGDKFYLGGVYFTELSRSGKTFFDGIAAKLVSDHDEVIGWNDTSLSRDRRRQVTSSILAAAVILMLMVDTVLLSSLLFSG